MAFRDQRFLDSARIKMITQTLASELDKNRPLVWINRLPLVNAFDDEIMGRFVGTVIAADIIADDQQAVVQESLSLETWTNNIPNIKIGQRLGQATLNRLNRLANGSASVAETNALEEWENMLAENLILGVRQRMNALACAMMLDSLTYDRLGIKLSGVGWGMPSTLKVTPAITWDNPTTAVPISDLLTMNEVSMDAYGFRYDKVTMSSRAFRYMVATTEFANKASLYQGANFLLTSAALNTKDVDLMTKIFGQITGFAIEIDDGTCTERTNAGAKFTRRYLPINKVVLSRKQDENNGNVMDFANGIVTESIVGSLVENSPISGGEEFGPIAYYTGREDLNPPDVTAWGVVRGFPRKHVLESTAVLTVGTFTS